MTDRVRVTVVDDVAHVRLNRPDKMNALDPAMFAALIEAGADLRDSPEIRAVVLSGEGRAFCAGLDLERLVATTRGEPLLPPVDLTQRTHGVANYAQHLVWLWRELPVPVIAAVHGVAFGGGFQLALGADLRYLAPDTKLAVIETKWGLVPDMCGTQLMRHLAREDIVRELTYTGRVFSADEAVTYGFATRLVDDPVAAALATAREIAGRSPDAIRAAKRLLNLSATCQVATGLAAETAEQAALLGSVNHVEAVRSNLEGRTPRWSRA
ncbi:crotonase/enoyl-CoA hydratase family protein [Bradyrhizobium centrosematis]|uniref:crotonase/enoyl-CoA hydratase family protein n=1 Tax=Bradyrhizobium centrosematis TaxID=1300039 RepID=UPI0021694703|nr:crotonase/enoyl-CoA hydratase family protein [Bradyrhizobium centrosematis]MCS3763643.1 enoyl-CoA hydratase/carnithine racemase [Bradyrhizobium centrosematis]MCS3777304.1 enoyl-CoA hydratase/carnithine racemase [Bradyrhizobium centrosematis]